MQPDYTPEYSRELAQLLQEQLDQEGFSTAFDSLHGVFRFSVLLDGRMGSASVSIEVSETGFAVFVTCPLRADPADARQMHRISEFLHRVNYRLYSGNFEINMDSGLIRFRNYCDAVDVLPSQSIVDFLILGSIANVEQHASGIVDMLYTDADPARTLDDLHEGLSEGLQGLLNQADDLEDSMEEEEETGREQEEEDGFLPSGSSGFLA